MNDYLPDTVFPTLLVPLAGVLLLVILWILYRRFGKPPRTLKSVIAAIAYERLSDLVIPKADEGEIFLDHLLLTPSGLLILDIKQVEGVVFGSDKMQDWTVMASDRRYTFTNPQHALYDRMAAVRQLVREVPVTGRVLFLDGADFTKGVPAMVCNLDELLEQFADNDSTGAASKIDAFKPHWERIRQAAQHDKAVGNRRRKPRAQRA